MTVSVYSSGTIPGLFACSPGWIIFPDSNLKVAVRKTIGKPEGLIISSDLEGFTSLLATEGEVMDITGLEHWTDLVNLNLYDNQINDISPLASLANLIYLNLALNEISNISPLTSLTNLKWLGLFKNPLSNTSVDIIRQLQERGVKVVGVDVSR